MQCQCSQRHIFCHAVSNTRVKHSDNFHGLRNFRDIELIDTCTNRENHAQLGKHRQKVLGQHPDDQVLNLRGVSLF